MVRSARLKTAFSSRGFYRKQRVFHTEGALKDFLTDFMPVLRGNPGKLDAGIRELVAGYQVHLRTRDLGKIYFAILYELIEHEEEVQQRVFHLLPFLTERGQARALAAIIDRSEYGSIFVDAVRRIQDLSHYFQRKKMYIRAVRRIKQEINAKNRETREEGLGYLSELPVSFRLHLLRLIFRSSYIHHHIQQKAILLLISLPSDITVKMIERIVKLRDADEGLVQACIDILPSIEFRIRPRILRVLLRHAPYDLVAIRSVEALQHIPAKYVPPILYEQSARTIEASFRLESTNLQILAASMISRFPEPYLSRLVRNVWRCPTELPGLLR
jgi:hypothetical protein